MKPNVISNICACGVLALTATLLLAPPRAVASSGTMVVTTDTTLTEDHHGNILINASKVTLDCAGHTVSGPGVAGFNGGLEVSAGLTGVTVRRCNVTGFDVNGIFSGGGATDGRYEANVSYKNGNHGIHLDVGSGYVVLGNTCHSNGAIGIVLTGGTNSWIVQNTVDGNHNWAGIALIGRSDNNWVLGNTASHNGIGIVLDGATNNQLSFNNVSSNDNQGFQLIRSANQNLIDGNSVDKNLIGVEVTDASDSNEIRNNEANLNVLEGFKVYQSDGNTFKTNVANKNGTYGFLVFGGASFNTMIGNFGRGNALFDGYDEDTGTGDVWKNNHFVKTSGF